MQTLEKDFRQVHTIVVRVRPAPGQARWSAAKRSGSNGVLELLVSPSNSMEAGRRLCWRVIWKLGQHVSEPGLRIDHRSSCRFPRGIDGGGAMAACI